MNIYIVLMIFNYLIL